MGKAKVELGFYLNGFVYNLKRAVGLVSERSAQKSGKAPQTGGKLDWAKQNKTGLPEKTIGPGTGNLESNLRNGLP
ncbi:MAG: hypothetical protein A2600_11555 [Candidatus Lambdaproteobacteria bacterium RIFOXYD1_FULL_56_27]|uniref:Uncharacterized protein n=1 Tax=Candidatus Lambdaproteobacteria bacterium RIFOXYD2_FULL_56_26 TaxID=1817773 RepID=A0A1F6GYI5_9PROT|nr:MAG: hypothetical protein A2426_06185 [Candidatus Lambdaproteobacteria bacterium RIFOXYC1_FULL_56_13]OGH03233.1 MAG: hypothetical protein A2557_00730 [Candidatus Lambdaproteobacteria bacterium RIFOXYD2_FULL_56_26]OGH08170.1 MAG: hypothetical protein A2600_11555 [Candidatus Lambdaproteobacteria bacterium RIFOXYD1_FULL_56_27]